MHPRRRLVGLSLRGRGGLSRATGKGETSDDCDQAKERESFHQGYFARASRPGWISAPSLRAVRSKSEFWFVHPAAIGRETASPDEVNGNTCQHQQIADAGGGRREPGEIDDQEGGEND